MRSYSSQQVEVELDKIKWGVYNPRLRFPDEYIYWLAESLKADGQWETHPIIVRRSDLAGVDGACRAKAAKKLGWRKIKAVLVDVTEEEAMISAIKYNLRTDLEPMEIGEHIRKILERMKRGEGRVKAIGRIAGTLNKRPTWIYECIEQAERLHPKVKEQYLKAAKKAQPITEGEKPEAKAPARIVTSTHLQAISKLPLEKQLPIFRRVVDARLTTRETEDVVKRVLEASGEVEQALEKLELRMSYADKMQIFKRHEWFARGVCPECKNMVTLKNPKVATNTVRKSFIESLKKDLAYLMKQNSFMIRASPDFYKEGAAKRSL